MDGGQDVRHFLDLIRKSRRGKLKIYIGMIAGVGKTCRMLQDAREMLRNGVDVWIGYVETHGRPGTEAALEGLPVVPRKRVFYKGKEVEEMDVDAILMLHPELAVVDELAHTNVEGSRNGKRWQDVMELLDAGINVVTAVNIQHIESLDEEVREIAGVSVAERVPDSVLHEADEVVNIDLTAEELIGRLRAGKIYQGDKAQRALDNFFKPETILRLRELALREVALSVERQAEDTAPSVRRGKILACVSSNPSTPRGIIRKAYRLARQQGAPFVVLYAYTPRENPDTIELAAQRHLLNHFKLAAELGGSVRQVETGSFLDAVVEVCRRERVTAICMGHPSFGMPGAVLRIRGYRRFLRELADLGIDLIIVS